MTKSQLLTVDYSYKPSLIPFEIESHPDCTDTVQIDVSKIELVLTLKKGETRITGNENRERLKKQKGVLLDVRVLEELLKYPELIPESWKSKYIYFWGTIFRDPDGDLCVACLYWSGDGWDWVCHWLDDDWDADEPAAVVSSIGPLDSGSSELGTLESRVLELENFKNKVEKILKL